LPWESTVTLRPVGPEEGAIPISVTCSGCQKKLKAKDTLAGKTVRCPGCGEKLLLPALEEEVAATLLLEEETRQELAAAAVSAPKSPYELAPREVPPPRPNAAAKRILSLPPLGVKEPPLWLRHLHWLLVLAIIPLAFSLLQEDKDNFFSRLGKTLHSAPPPTRQKIARVLNGFDEGRGSFEDLFAVLPDNKLADAFLSRRSWTHWVFAGAAAALFFSFIFFLGHGTGNQVHLLGVALFTATIGIFSCWPFSGSPT
jgi:DNA-directed RNA polymerase subunit RPC12/RpoP